jgi:hypothetical protein
MKRVVWLVRVAGLCILAGLFVLGCQGSHQHTATEPVAASLEIGNLKTMPFIRYAGNVGELPLSFDYIAPDGDVSQVLVTTGDTTDTTPARGVAGLTSGTISFSQSVRLPDPTARQLAFSVQVVDTAGHHSNTLSGRVDVP